MSCTFVDVQIGLAILAPLLQVCILVFMWKRRLYREYLAFVVYTAWQIIRAVILQWVWHRVDAGVLGYASYFYSYWVAELISTALGLAVIHSIFISVTRGYRATRNWGNTLFLIATAMLLGIAVWAAYFVPVNSTSTIVAGVLLLERSVLILQAGLLLLLILFSSVLGISLKHRIFGITLGFGIYASVHLVSAAIRTHAGADYDALFRLSKSIAYNVAVLLWFVYLCLPQRDRKVNQLPVTNINEWNESLLEILK
jgi:hypothetical protein